MRAFVFPGQGSQYSGMASDFSVYPSWFEYAERARNVLGFDITEIMDGDEDTLKLTENAQPAIFLTSYVAFVDLLERGVSCDIMAGHSLGEYTALAAAGVYDFEIGIYLVRKRGEYISAAIEPGKGSMAAVLGVAPEFVEEAARNYEQLYVANYNTKEQTVVSGVVESVRKFVEDMRARGVKAMELKVSGPFHTPLLESARERMAREVEHIKFKVPSVPIVMNSTGRETTDPEELKKYLLEQISGPVLWYQSIERMRTLGVSVFIEVGPKNVLSAMLKKSGANAAHFTELLKEVMAS